MRYYTHMASRRGTLTIVGYREAASLNLFFNMYPQNQNVLE
jgi:hypothetical protein